MSGERANRTLRGRIARASTRWLSRGGRPIPLRDLLPRRRAHWWSAVALVGLFGAFLAVWIGENREILFDPWIQTDDARAILRPFLVDSASPGSERDPIAGEMLRYVPPLPRALYSTLAPPLGVYRAAKLVQGIAFGLLFLSGWVLVRTRGAGLAAGVLLTFLGLHTTWVVHRISGGLPRSFAYGAILLWVAGAVRRSGPIRLAAILLAAASYPPAALLLLAAEGFELVQELVRGHRQRAIRRLRLLLVAGALGGAFVILPTLAGSGSGAIRTLSEARLDPAFGPAGRLRVLPFPNPLELFAANLTSPFRDAGSSPLPAIHDAYSRLADLGPALLLVVLLAASLRSAARAPRLFVSLLGASVALYAAAVVLAFRLYSPERFASFGAISATIALVVSVLALRSDPAPDRAREATRRNWRASGALAFLWLVLGSGSVPRNGGTVDRRDSAGLWEFAERLPPASRIAAHPWDADDFAFWTGRPTTDGYETLQPWHVDLWRVQRARTEETLQALYATDRASLLDYTRRNGITHLLLRIGRYGPRFRERSHLFEPFDSELAARLREVRREELVLAEPPRSAILYDAAPFRLVDVALLAAAWRRDSSNEAALATVPR
ncbi:MAG: hypothetical protein R2862_02540 [Thermoanaerobaculia bacterium]